MSIGNKGSSSNCSSSGAISWYIRECTHLQDKKDPFKQVTDKTQAGKTCHKAQKPLPPVISIFNQTLTSHHDHKINEAR